MGQQQLLLLVLGIVIVGLAVVVGINAFSENRTKSNGDALVTDGLRIASDIQAWRLKPEQFGGGNGEGIEMSDVTFAKIGYPESSGGGYNNVNGSFTIETSDDCEETPVPKSGNDILVFVNATNESTGNTVCIGIAGTSADDIGTVVEYGT